MKKIILFSIMALFTLTGCAGKKTVEPASNYLQDVIAAKDGTEITLTFYAHASIAVEALGYQIYVDPVGENVDWAQEPKADLVLVTHDHYDHYDAAAIEALNGTGEFLKMKPGETAEPFEGILVEAVPAYNITEEHQDFHPQERGDAGYIITVGGTRIYVAGDTEDNDDVLALKDIDVAFLPVNQPYTMTVEQCVRVVEAIRPAVFYPYHFGGTDESTDMDALVDAVKDITDIRVRPLE